MIARKSEGFVLSLVIVAFGLLAVVMLVLTEGSNTMLFQADTSYLRAVERNLKASGEAWAEHQMSQDRGMDGPVSLDASALSDRPVSLTVQRETTPDANTIRIDTQCQKGHRTCTDSYVLPLSQDR